MADPACMLCSYNTVLSKPDDRKTNNNYNLLLLWALNVRYITIRDSAARTARYRGTGTQWPSVERTVFHTRCSALRDRGTRRSSFTRHMLRRRFSDDNNYHAKYTFLSSGLWYSFLRRTFDDLFSKSMNIYN